VPPPPSLGESLRLGAAHRVNHDGRPHRQALVVRSVNGRVRARLRLRPDGFGASDRSRSLSRNDVTLRGARRDRARGRSGRSRPWPRIRAKPALGPTGPVPLSGGTWRESNLAAFHFPSLAASLFPRPGSRSGFPARRAWRVGLESPTYVRIFFARVIFPVPYPWNRINLRVQFTSASSVRML
jgi:hypothetical protein